MYELIQQARDIVAGRSLYVAATDHLRALLAEIDRLADQRAGDRGQGLMDDKRLIRCRHCGNEILLDAGDKECYYCHALLACPLPDSDRARLAAIAGPVAMLLQSHNDHGLPLSVTGVESALVAILHMCAIVGVPLRELAEYARLYSESTDKERWLREMT